MVSYARAGRVLHHICTTRGMIGVVLLGFRRTVQVQYRPYPIHLHNNDLRNT